MLAIITRTIARFKESWGLELDDQAILGAMREAGHVWRDRGLNPVTTGRLFLMQILFGTAAGPSSVRDGRFQLLDAGHRRVAKPFRPERRSGTWLRLSHRPLAGPGAFWERPVSEGDCRAAANPAIATTPPKLSPDEQASRQAPATTGIATGYELT